MLKLFLCLKYLRKKKLAFFAVAAVTLSCALLITVASLFTGFINAVEISAVDAMGDIMISPPMLLSDYQSLITRLEADPAVEAASGILFSRGLLHIGRGNVRTVNIWGIEPEKEFKVTSLEKKLIRNNYTDQSPLPAAGQTDNAVAGFVGIGVIAEPNVTTDEYDFPAVRKFLDTQVVLITGAVGGFTGSAEPADASKIRQKTLKLTIADIIHSGVHELDKERVIIPLRQLQNLMFPDSENKRLVRSVHIKLAAGIDSDTALRAVGRIWEDFASNELGWSEFVISQTEIETAKQMQSRYIAEIRKQLGLLMLIFGILCGAVVLLVFCIFYMIVITRRKDIAVIRSCGLSRFAVASLFFLYGGLVGIAGSLLGLLCGYLVTKNISSVESFIRAAFGIKLWKSSVYLFEKIPNQLDIHSACWILVAAVAASVLGALIPAVAAARLKPVEILRYE